MHGNSQEYYLKRWFNSDLYTMAQSKKKQLIHIQDIAIHIQ